MKSRITHQAADKRDLNTTGREMASAEDNSVKTNNNRSKEDERLHPLDINKEGEGRAPQPPERRLGEGEKLLKNKDTEEELNMDEDMEVKDMFMKIMQKMNTLQNSVDSNIRSMKEENKNVAERVTKVEAAQTLQDQKISDVGGETKFMQSKMTMMAGVIERQSQVINELNYKLEAIELRKLRPNLMITGLTETKNEECVTVVKNFIKDRMEIEDEIGIKRAYRVGKSQSRPLLAVLSNPQRQGHDLF